MAIIYTYPKKASVEATDTFLITDSADNNTKTVSASAIASYIDDEVDLQEVLNKGNTASQDINLTGDYNGSGNINLSGKISINGAAQGIFLDDPNIQQISKNSGPMRVITLGGDLELVSVTDGISFRLKNS